MEPARDLWAIEQAAVRGWPARETAVIDGWLARATSGGSVRANTVAALDYTGRDLDQSIAAVEAFYRERQATPRIAISDASAPAQLDGELERRGWRRSGDHVTMAKDIATRAGAPLPATPIRLDLAPTPDWYAVYLQGLTENRQGAAPAIVERVPPPRVFVSAIRDGRVIASGLTVIDGVLASVQCMATVVEARRSGAATAVLAAIEDTARTQGAGWLYLQTDHDNWAARSAYERFGFAVVGRYHTRDLIA